MSKIILILKTNALQARLEKFATDMLTNNVAVERELTNLHNRTRNSIITALSKGPSKSNNPSGFIKNDIANNISSSVVTRGRSFVAGTGHISTMDKKDPIYKLTPRRKLNRNRLWRILEYGTRPHPIVARNKPYLVFFHRASGKYIRKQEVWHPGTQGYMYFAINNARCGRLFHRRMPNILKQLVRTH